MLDASRFLGLLIAFTVVGCGDDSSPGTPDGSTARPDGSSGGCTSNSECDDDVACTRDLCDDETGQCVNLPDGPDCRPSCTRNADCDDALECTRDLCDDETGTCINAPDGPDCRPPECRVNAECDDASDCTNDVCDDETGECVNVPIMDGCMSGECTGASDCNDGVACTTDACTTGRCTHTPDSSMCPRDGCMQNVQCDPAMGCVGDARVCDDGVACTADSCEAASGCLFAPDDSLCPSGNTCSTTDGCSGGTCTTPADCDDGDPCTMDNCEGGRCVRPPVSCDDGNPCTDDECNPTSGACASTPHARLCDDGDACTDADRCSGGTCRSTPRTCSDGNPCTTDACNPSSGSCSSMVTSGVACDDGDPCTTGTMCSASGACTGGSGGCPDDGNPCTIESCSGSGCMQANAPNGMACGSGRQCCNGTCSSTATDAMNCGSCGNRCMAPTNACVGGTCTSCGSDADCDDGQACTTDRCNMGLRRCEHPPMPNFCFIDGQCYAEGTANPAAQCQYCRTSYSVAGWTGMTNVACEDGLFCTINDLCNIEGVCVGGIANCDDFLTCTTDSCSEATDSCSHVIQPTWCVYVGFGATAPGCHAMGELYGSDDDFCNWCNPTVNNTLPTPARENHCCEPRGTLIPGRCIDGECTASVTCEAP